MRCALGQHDQYVRPEQSGYLRQRRWVQVAQHLPTFILAQGPQVLRLLFNNSDSFHFKHYVLLGVLAQDGPPHMRGPRL